MAYYVDDEENDGETRVEGVLDWFGSGDLAGAYGMFVIE
jgi:hypothetical protein